MIEGSNDNNLLYFMNSNITGCMIDNNTNVSKINNNLMGNYI